MNVLRLVLCFLLLLPLGLFGEDSTDEPIQQNLNTPPLQESKQDNPRPILDSPSLRIPAHPAYQTNLQALGYKDAKELLEQTLQAQSSVRSVTFDQNGHIAAGSDDGTVKLWDAQSGKLKQTLQAQSSVHSVAFDQNGHIAAGSSGGTIKLWDVQSGKLKQTTLQQTLQAQSTALSVAFGQNGHIAAGFIDGTVRLWEAQSGKLKQTLQLRAQSSVSIASPVAFGQNGHIAAGSGEGTVKLWNAQSGKLKQALQAQSSVNSVAFDQNGHIAAGLENGIVKLWDTQSGELKQTLQAQSSVNSVAFDQNGHVAAGSVDGTVKLWEVQSGKLKQILQAQSTVNSVAFDQNGHIAAGSVDGTIRLWGVQSGRLKQTLQAHTGRGRLVIFDQNGHIAAGSSDGTVRLWEAQSGELKQILQTQSRVHSVAFDQNGHIAAGSSDGIVRLWEAQSGKLKQALHMQSRVSSVTFDQSGHIAAGSSDGTVRLWEAQSGKLKQTLQAQSSIVSVAFGKNEYIFAGSSDGTVRLWESQSGTLKQTLQLQAQSIVLSVAFDKNGRIATGSGDGTIRLWDSHGSLLNQLIATGGGFWLSLLTSNELLVADNGSLLRRGIKRDEGKTTVLTVEITLKYGELTEKLAEHATTYSSWLWKYLPAPISSTQSLQLKLKTPIISLTPDQATFFTIQLSNTSSDPIHRPRILQTQSESGEIQIIQAEYQPTFPQTTAIYSSTSLIPPGETIELTARVISNTDKPATSGEYTIPVIIEVSGGERTEAIPLTVNLSTPDVVITASDYSSNNRTLNIGLKNQGTAALPESDFYLIDTENQDLQLPRQSLDTIAPGSETALAFTLPDTIDKTQRDRLQLEIRPMAPPLYTHWYLPLEIRGMALHLQALLALAIFSLLAFAIWYIRRHQRYNHPLVTDISSTPEQLLALPIETLTEAQHRLSDTGHLGKVLEQQNISPQRMTAAIDFNAASANNKAMILAERLYAKTEQPVEALHWLQLPDDFPLDVDDLLLFQPDSNTPVEEVRNTLRQNMEHIPHLERPLCLLLGEDNHYRNRLLRISEDYSNNLVTLTSRNLTRLLLSEKPQDVLAGIIAEQVSLDQISPYQLGGGVDRETVFFGRKNLITRIMNRAPANYLLVGGRQLGKSSLLKALKRRYDKQRDVQCHYLVLKGETLQRDLSDVLQLSEQTDLSDLLAELRQRMTQKRYVFLIDEADDFIRAERDNDYLILKELRSLSETGQCTFVLAGFWQLYDYATLDYQSPLKNFGEILHLGELEEEACTNLAAIPMAMMNLHYASSTLIQTLTQETGQRANLIATACHEIINNLDDGQHEITAADVKEALDSDEVAGKLAGWDSSETDHHTRQLDRIVIYAGVQLENFSYGGLLEFLESKDFRPDANELQRSLDRLKLGFVLGEAKKRYYFRVPLFKRQLQEDEPDIRLRAELRSLKSAESNNL